MNISVKNISRWVANNALILKAQVKGFLQRFSVEFVRNHEMTTLILTFHHLEESPSLKLILSLPGLTLERHKENEFGEFETNYSLNLGTAIAFGRNKELGFLYCGVRVLGFGVAFSSQKEYGWSKVVD